MTAPLSQDLRRRLVRAVDEGSSARAAAARFQVSVSTAIKLVRRVRETGSTEPAKMGGYRKPLLAGHEGLTTFFSAIASIRRVHSRDVEHVCRERRAATARSINVGWESLGDHLFPKA